MTWAVHVPYTVEQDEDGAWCARAQLRPGAGANGESDRPDLAGGGLIAESGILDELTLMVDGA
jgi:hypothetical protein